MFNLRVASLELLVNKMEATGNKVEFSSIHPDLNILISLLKFGILAEKHHPGALNCDNHSRGIFICNNLKRAVSVICNMSCYIKGQNKSFLHQNHGTGLASPRAASNGDLCKKMRPSRYYYSVPLFSPCQVILTNKVCPAHRTEIRGLKSFFH